MEKQADRHEIAALRKSMSRARNADAVPCSVFTLAELNTAIHSGAHGETPGADDVPCRAPCSHLALVTHERLQAMKMNAVIEPLHTCQYRFAMNSSVELMHSALINHIHSALTTKVQGTTPQLTPLCVGVMALDLQSAFDTILGGSCGHCATKDSPNICCPAVLH
eukprot:5586792-Amphidinium_carterae.2